MYNITLNVTYIQIHIDCFMILQVLIFLFVFVGYTIWTKEHTLPEKSWLFALLYAVSMLTSPMSHLWHILYGEDRIVCGEANVDEVFGWTSCFEFTWNYLVNTYEITLPIENIILTGIAVYTIMQIFKLRREPRVIIVYILLGIHMLLGVILLCSPPKWLDEGFDEIYNWSGFILTTFALITLELLIETSKNRDTYTSI